MKNIGRVIFSLALATSALAAETAHERGKRVVNEALQAVGGKAFLAMEDRVESGRAYSFFRQELEGLSVAKIYTRYVTAVPGQPSVRERQNFGKDESSGGVLFNQDGAWESLSEADQAEGFGRMRAVMARNLKAPAVQAAELAAGVKDLQKDGDACSGELTEATAKTLLAFGRRPGGDAPEATGVKGSAKFWLKDGALTKYEYKVKGKMSFNGQERDVDRTTTVEIKDVGATKVSVPEAAKKKLS